MLEKIKAVIQVIKTSKRAKIGLAILGVLILILIILILIGKQEVSKEYSNLPEEERIIREKNEGNFIQKMGKYLKSGADKVLTDLRLKKAKEIPISPTPAAKEEKNLNRQIAEKLINWLISLREKQGGEESYSIGYSCQFQGNCLKNPSDRQVTIPVLWSYFNYYNATKKPEILEMIKQTINLYSKQSTQPDFWHCKLLYDLKQSNIFSSAEKEQLQAVCLNTFLLRLNKMSLRAENNDINQFQAQKIINQLKNPTTLTTVSDLIPKDEREFLLYSTYASDLVFRYFWFNAPSNLNLAKTYFDQALLFYQNQKKSPPASLPFLVITTVDMYKATGNGEYLKFATYLTEVALQQRQTNTFNAVGLALLEKEMFQLTGEKKYQDHVKQIINYLINYGFDEKGHQGYRRGMEAFHNLSTTNYIYDTRTNALLVSFLAN